MILTYHVSMAGPHHLDEGKPCQDAYAIRMDKAPFTIAAVADGLGSELFSDVGASIAVQTAVDDCAEHLEEEMGFDRIKKIMNNALVRAYLAVLNKAEEDQQSPAEYDSTLCLCVYDGEHLYYAQSGDSGLVALLANGEYRRITTQQRDGQGRVFPLCFGPEKWVFGQVEEPVSAALLMTDGVFDKLCHPLLRGKEIDINIAMARKLMDHFDCNEDTVTDLQSGITEYLEHFPHLTDDKTVVALINNDRVPAEMPAEYYAVPDWKALEEEVERKLYSKNSDKDEEVPFADTENKEDCEAPVAHPAPPSAAGNDGDKEQDEPSASTGTSVKEENPVPEDDRSPPVPKEEEDSRRDHSERAPFSAKAFWINIGGLIFVLLFGLLAYFVSGYMAEHPALTAVGVFLACFFSNASLLLPTSSILIAMQYAMIIHPLLAILCATAGATLGEVTGFLAGKCGRKILPARLNDWLCRHLRNHQIAMVIVAAVLPMPGFDVVGMLAGASGMKLPAFLCACLCGKAMKYLSYVWIAQTISALI